MSPSNIRRTIPACFVNYISQRRTSESQTAGTSRASKVCGNTKVCKLLCKNFDTLRKYANFCGKYANSWHIFANSWHHQEWFVKCKNKNKETCPHARGDITVALLEERLAVGTSPRTWGNPNLNAVIFVSPRYIPTHVGKSRKSASSRSK